MSKESPSTMLAPTPSTDKMSDEKASTPLTSQETKRRELDALLLSLQREKVHLIASMKDSISSDKNLPLEKTSEVDEQAEERNALVAARSLVQGQISRLTKYNEVKDVAQGLIGLIAERKGVRIADVMEDYGVEEND